MGSVSQMFDNTPSTTGDPTGDDIAVVGFSFKLPQDVNDVSSLWEVLQNRRNLLTPWPEARINAEAFLSGKSSKINCHGGYFINDDPASFDAPFFSISTKEAAALDPMQRWTLETSYRAFENAGISVEKLRGSKTGVFSASFTDDWSRMNSQDPDNVERAAATGTASSLISNRVSWYFDMRGPSVHIDTACSSSLFALDMACQSLRACDSTTALVTGSSLILTPAFTSFLSNLGFLSPDSKCWAFDHRANGYARGEGFIALVLKPVSAALRDGDMIRAIVRASGSNQDGQTPSLTQPSPRAQEELIRSVYKKANLTFDQTRYVEAHGTGTPVGDPIEAKAIGNVFRRSRSPEEPLYIGSVKTNIGHLEGSSGLAGVIKSIVSLEKGVIPPHALYEQMNPDIDAEFYNIAIPMQLVAWPSDGLRRISVNSFGFGGTNTHVVLDDAYHYMRDHGFMGNHCTAKTVAASAAALSNQQITNGISAHGATAATSTNGTKSVIATGGPGNCHNKGPEVINGRSQDKYRLLVWSSADEKAIERTVAQQKTFYRDHVAGNPKKVDQLAYTLAERRSHLLWRSSAIVMGGLGDALGLSTAKPVRSTAEVGLAFVFTGQGAQYANMGLNLIRQYPLFVETLQHIDRIYSSIGCEWNLLDELRNGNNINLPEYSQPLSTAIQIALVELLKSFGVIPKAVIGHSSGEIAAAYSVGALSLESACKVSYFRGRLAGVLRATSSTPGAMISVNLPERAVPAYLERICISDVSIACINSPLNCTLSGPDSSIAAVKEQAEKDAIFAQMLRTGVAYHSTAMVAIADEYKKVMGILEGANSPCLITMISSVTGQTVRPAVLATAQYWVENMVSPVRFTDAIHALTQQSSTWKSGYLGAITDLVEIGPTAALRRPVVDTLNQAGPRTKNVRYSSALYRERCAVLTTLELAGELFAYGHRVSITAVNKMSSCQGTFLVDCPEYPFDHSNKYWAESRISRDYRLRGTVIGETLGTRVADWNPLQPRWRNFISVESDAWVAGHNISNTVIYPATGMMIMSMEAALQIVPANQTITGYYIKEAQFMSPIVIGEAWEERTETIVELRTLQKSHEKTSTWSDVRVFCYRNKEWSECFSALIQVQFEQDGAQPGVLQEKRHMDEDILRRYEVAVEACTRPVDSQVFYRNASDHGLRYGDWFQLLENLHWDGKRNAIARIDVSKTQFRTTSLLHPAVLDAVFQMLRASCQGSPSASATNVPVKMLNAWFAASGWQSPETDSLRCWGASLADQDTGEDGSICALGDDGTVLMVVEHITTVAVSRLEESGAPRKLLHSAHWKPQLSLLEPQQLSQVCIQSEVGKDEATAIAHHAEITSIMNMALCKTLGEMTAEDNAKIPAALHRHMAWINHHISMLGPTEKESTAVIVTNEELERRLQHLETIRPPWTLHTSVVRELKNILIGEKDPLEVIFDSDLADVFYADMFAQICDARLQNFLELASHENPGLRILEVGAGTGGFTGHVLTALQHLEKETGGLKLAEYTYTDISPMFFEKARERWKALEGRINFKPLDLEHRLESQGFSIGSYDLVVAGSVLHATADLVSTMKNVRTALKPGGRALILEVVAPEDVAVNFSFGLVPGWWLAREEWRKMSPLLNEEQWDVRLKESGYSGNDLVLRDHEADGCHICSIIISTAVEEVTSLEGPKPTVALLIDKHSESQCELASLIHRTLDAPSAECVVKTLSLEEFQHNIQPPEGVILCLASLDKPFLADMDDSKLRWLQHLMRHAKKLIWVSGAGTEDSQQPFYSLSNGFFRSLRLEMTDSHIVTLTIESTATLSADNHMENIIKVFRASFLESASKELEYVVRNGMLETCRIAEDVNCNAALDSILNPRLRQKAWSEVPALALSIKTAGTLDSLCFTEDMVLTTELAAGEVEIEAKAWGTNFRDVLQALGRLDERTFGADCAGVVTRVGRDCRHLFQAGDRVCMIVPGCMRRYARATSTSVIKIPKDEMSFVAAAATLVPGMTAYHALHNIARIRKGETILIHSAAGSTGQMAVAIAKAQGAVVYATVGSEEKKDFLMNTLGVPEGHIFHSRNTSFAQAIMRITKGRGVDVVLNSLSGDSLRASWECIARRGRFVEIGKVDILANSGLPMSNFSKNVTFSAVDLREIIMEDPTFTAELLQRTMQFVCDTGASPTPVHSFPASQVEQAFRTLQNGTNIGRIVIEPRADDVVSQYLQEQRPWRFDGNASYIVAGGFGGIGRAILLWMAGRGAKYLIVPSRSGAASKAASDVLMELRASGVCIVAPTCDVASESSLSAVLEEYARTMPPIKGCIDAALALQDAMFENMTLPQWDLAVKAKVNTAWNLHRLLPKNLDFFVLLSSLAGVVGQMATANYAGGCTYQDALARYRVEHGEKALSLDIGWMRDIGIVAETAAFQRQRLATEDMQQIGSEDLMALLSLCCDPAATLGTPEQSQVLVGLRTPADFLIKGQVPPGLLEQPLFSAFSSVAGTQTAGGNGQAADPAALFRAAADSEEKVQVVISSLVAKLARAMSISPADVELSKPLSSYGVDSLMAVELRNWIRRDFAAPVAIFDIMGGVPISAVGQLVVTRSTAA